MADVTFTITVAMKDRWVNDFCSMLKWMEDCGQLGHSSFVGFYADGDGDFRPKFAIGTEYERKDGIMRDKIWSKPEIMFDAG